MSEGPRWTTLLGLAILVAAILGGSMPYFEALLDANERPRLLAGAALVETGSVRVDGPTANGIPTGPDVALAADGTLVPNKPPGATLVAAGTYALLRAATGERPTLRAYTIAARIVGGLAPTLLAAWILWRWERRWAGGEGPAGRARVDFAVLAWLLATPAWANAKLLFGHALAACLLTAGVVALAGEPDERPSHARAALGGLLTAAAITVEYTAVFAGPAIAVWLLVRERRRWTVILAATLAALVPVLCLAAYHDAVFGDPFTTGYHRVTDAGFSAIHGRGLLGLQLPTATSLYEHLLSPWGGLLTWAPLCALALLAGVHASWTGDGSGERGRQALCAAIAGSLLIVLVGLEQSGGWRVGPRYFVLAMPLTVPGLVVVLREFGERSSRAQMTDEQQRDAVRGRRHACVGENPRPASARVVLGLGLTLGLFASAAIANFLAASWFPHLIPHGNPLGDLLWPLAWSGRAPWGLSPWFVLALASALSGVVLYRLHRALAIPPATWLVAVGVAGAVHAALCLGPESDVDHSRELETIERIWEPDQAVRGSPVVGSPSG